MSSDSGNGAPHDTQQGLDTEAILTRLDELDDSVKAFQEQTNKQFTWLRTDLDSLRRYVKTLNQRTHDLEEDMLSRPSPAPDGLPTAAPTPLPVGR